MLKINYLIFALEKDGIFYATPSEAISYP